MTQWSMFAHTLPEHRHTPLFESRANSGFWKVRLQHDRGTSLFWSWRDMGRTRCRSKRPISQTHFTIQPAIR
jgi:hypothetical protein